ncbi:hypothetical protein CCP3SC15_4230001 [Gammaproteobacteria bacterium]
MNSLEASNELIRFIIENAKFDNKNNLLFNVSVNNSSRLAEEMKTWTKKEHKLNFGGLIGIRIIGCQQNGNMEVFSFSSDYLDINLMEFKHFVKKEPEISEYHEYAVKRRS